MSTMYDALKKAEAEHKRTAALETKNPQKDDPDQSEGIPENIKVAALLIAVIVVFGIVFLRIKASLGGPKRTAIVHTAMQTASTAQAPGPVVVPASPQQRAPGTYGLDGVIDAGENSMAIVNGKLLKVGGTIDSLVLQKISPKEVELLNTKDNSTVILKID